MELILGLSIAATAEDRTNYLFLYIFEVNAGSLRTFGWFCLVFSLFFIRSSPIKLLPK